METIDQETMTDKAGIDEIKEKNKAALQVQAPEPGNIVQMPQPQNTGDQMMALMQQMATSPNFSPDMMTQMLDAKEKWEAQEAKKEFNKAMAFFAANVPIIKKNAAAHNSTYATLDASLARIQPILEDAKLSISWKIEDADPSFIRVRCCVSHVSGHQECTSMGGEPDTSGSKNAIQSRASTVKYLERYTMYALLGITSADMPDDDGAGGAGGEKEDEYISENELADLYAKMEEVNADKKAFLKVCKLESFEKMPKEKLAGAIAKLEAKGKQGK